MKKFKLLLTLTIFTVGVFSVVQKRNDEVVEVKAATIQTQKRVYAYLDGAWDNAAGMHIHYWGGSSGSDWNNKPAMTRVLSDYYVGLFYYDVPSNTTHVIFSAWSGDPGKNSNRTDDLPMSSLFPSGSYKAAKISGWQGDDNKYREVWYTDLAMSTGQFGAVLGHVDTCNSDYAFGFNSYPQIDELITSKSGIDRNAKVTNGPKESNAPTIGAKLDYMQALYIEDQGLGSGVKYEAKEANLNSTMVISLLGVTTLAGYYFLTRKKKVA